MEIQEGSEVLLNMDDAQWPMLVARLWGSDKDGLFAEVIWHDSNGIPQRQTYPAILLKLKPKVSSDDVFIAEAYLKDEDKDDDEMFYRQGQTPR